MLRQFPRMILNMGETVRNDFSILTLMIIEKSNVSYFYIFYVIFLQISNQISQQN